MTAPIVARDIAATAGALLVLCTVVSVVGTVIVPRKPYLSLCPQAAPAVPTRLCLRSGLVCFAEVARSMGIKVPAEPAPHAVISLSYAEFLDAVDRLREVNFPIEREPEAAWPHFVGWRVNYEQAAYAIAAAIDAVPALWSGP